MAEITAAAVRTIADQIEAGWYGDELVTLHIEADGATGHVVGHVTTVDPDSLDTETTRIEV